MNPEIISTAFSQAPNPPQECDGSARFHSILFTDSENGIVIDGQVMPEIFADLNLDQVVETMTVGRNEYNLKPFFYIPLRHIATTSCETLKTMRSSGAFSHSLKRCVVCEDLAQADKLYCKRQKQSRFLDAVEIYCAAVGLPARDR